MSEKAKRLRSTQLHFYVNDQELDLIRTKMKQAGTDNLSVYLRKMAVDGYVIRLDMRELKELTRLLGNIAGSENQIAKRVNETGTVYAEDLEEIKKYQEEIKESVNKILLSLADLLYRYSLDADNAADFIDLIPHPCSETKANIEEWLCENIQCSGFGSDLQQKWIQMGLHGSHMVSEDYPGGIYREEAF